MILFDLTCGRDHRFEAWFRNNATFDAQQAAAEIACPHCGDTAVRKAPMAPNLARSRGEPRRAPDDDTRAAAPRAAPAAEAPVRALAPRDDSAAPPPELVAEARKVLGALRDMVEKNCDYVGDRFAEEARRIHYGDVKPHAIYGEASAEDVRELADEGVEIAPIPWLPRQDS